MLRYTFAFAEHSTPKPADPSGPDDCDRTHRIHTRTTVVPLFVLGGPVRISGSD